MSELTEKVYKEYQKGLEFNDKLKLSKNVENNENFFIGK